jgi:hypothetical protein
MTDAPVPVPAEVTGLVAHVEAWLEKHVAPDIMAVKADIADARKFIAEHAANLQAVAALLGKVLTAASAADPALAAVLTPLVSEAEKILADVTEVAEKVDGTNA